MYISSICSPPSMSLWWKMKPPLDRGRYPVPESKEARKNELAKPVLPCTLPQGGAGSREQREEPQERCWKRGRSEPRVVASQSFRASMMTGTGMRRTLLPSRRSLCGSTVSQAHTALLRDISSAVSENRRQRPTGRKYSGKRTTGRLPLRLQS